MSFTTELKNIICNSNIETLIKYIILNNLKFNSKEILSIFLYSLENKASLDIVKYFETKYGVLESLEYLLSHNNFHNFKLIFNLQRYNNNYILQLIYLSRYRIQISHKKLQNIINKEQENIIISDTMYSTALKSNNYTILKFLLSNDTTSNIQSINKKYRLLHYVTKNNQTEILRILIKNIDIIENKKVYISILLTSIKCGNIDIVKMLIENEIDINYNYKNGFTPLMYAIFNKQKIISQYLLDVNANVNIENNHGNTALIIALKNGYLEIIEDLINHGADINHVNYNDDTALIIAIKKRYNETAKYLINNGANVNIRDSSGDTPLIIALKKENPDMVEYLIKHGANINDKDIYGNTPLYLAYDRCQIDIITILINNNANINEKNNNLGLTILMKISEDGFLLSVKYLVEKGANVNDTDSNGNSVLNYASKNEFHKNEIIPYLKAHGAFKIKV